MVSNVAYIVFNAAITVLIIVFVIITNFLSINELHQMSLNVDRLEVELWESLEYKEEPTNLSQYDALGEIRESRVKISALIESSEEAVLMVRIVITVFLFLVIYRYFMLSYVNAAQVHFRKTFDLCGPYFPEDKRLECISQFARIESKRDYQEIIKMMNKVLKEEDVSPPSFVIW